MGTNCPQCGSHHLRLSRLRSGDLLQVITLRVPVRCIDCRARSFVLVTRGAGIWMQRRARRRRSRANSKTA